MLVCAFVICMQQSQVFRKIAQTFYRAKQITLNSFLASSELCHLGDNCIQNFHLGRYIVGYTVGNLVYGDARAEP